MSLLLAFQLITALSGAVTIPLQPGLDTINVGSGSGRFSLYPSYVSDTNQISFTRNGDSLNSFSFINSKRTTFSIYFNYVNGSSLVMDRLDYFISSEPYQDGLGDYNKYRGLDASNPYDYCLSIQVITGLYSSDKFSFKFDINYRLYRLTSFVNNGQTLTNSWFYDNQDYLTFEKSFSLKFNMLGAVAYSLSSAPSAFEGSEWTNNSNVNYISFEDIIKNTDSLKDTSNEFVSSHFSPANDILEGYCRGFGFSVSFDMTSDGSYNLGYNQGYEQGEETGYNQGYNKGYLDGQEGNNNFFSLISSAFGSISSIFEFELFPGFSLGTLFLIPLGLGLLFLIIRLISA